MIVETREFGAAAPREAEERAAPGVWWRLAASAALALALATLWLLMHRYSRFYHDAQIYALQALAKLDLAYGADLFLKNQSQDEFTVFSRIYAWFIRLFGLERAALLLTIASTAGLLASAWALLGRLAGRDLAWFGVCALVLVGGGYGAAGVFHFMENFLTARSPAEALVVAALACQAAGLHRAALAVGIVAMCMHPLMALPGVLLLTYMRLPQAASLAAAGAGVAATLAGALLAAGSPAVAKLLPLMDPPWLEVVRERSQFLLLQLWSIDDWQLNLRPLACLCLVAASFPAGPVRKLCSGAILIGIAGFAIALIASFIGPVAILVQGQAWRWVWIADFLSILLFLPAAWRIWQDRSCGPLCALLLVTAWLFPAVNSLLCVGAALLLWSVRRRISDAAAGYLRLGAAALLVVIAVWVIANAWTIAATLQIERGRESLVLQRLRNFTGLQVPAILLFGGLWLVVRRARGPLVPLAACVVLAGAAFWLAPFSFRQVVAYDSPDSLREFADWRAAIPPQSAVYVADGRNDGLFVWYTLQRNNYLSTGESAGVVFSRTTALEVKRRSDVLLPLEDPDWRILSALRRARTANGAKRPESTRPLTAASLTSVCADPALDFVIAKEDVGFEPLTHRTPGRWKDWNLYDCRRVRGAGTRT